jgi:hypothetical protein
MNPNQIRWESTMLKHLRRVLTAIVVSAGALAPSMVTGQPPPPPKTPAPAPAVRPAPVQEAPKEYRAKQVLGTKIFIQGNIAVGTVDDIVFADDGRIEYLLVLNDGKYISVPWQAASFNFEKQMATVNITQEQYQVIPRFGLGVFPRFFAPAYRVETYKYYGLTPEQERRIERRK